MDAKQVDVDCPCCRSKLTVDVLTAKVLRWSAADEVDERGQRSEEAGEARWDAAFSRVDDREGRGAGRFDDALAKEQRRERDLDALFRDASERVKDDDPEA